MGQDKSKESKDSFQDSNSDPKKPGSVAAAQDIRSKTQAKLSRDTLSGKSAQATASKRQAQQEVHKGVGLAQRTARNTDRGSGRD